MTVQITRIGSFLSVSSPYNAEFVAQAKRLGGKWSNGAWRFDARDDERVSALCRDVYGTDGTTADLVTLRVTWNQDQAEYVDALSAHGRTIARATGRDSGARLGDGVVLLSGGFRSGGSMKNWYTQAVAGTVVLVRDFPRTAADELVAGDAVYRTYSIEPEAPVVDRDALQAERDRLVARIAEIDALLA